MVAGYFCCRAARRIRSRHAKFCPRFGGRWPTASDGGKTVTVKLREGLKFSDGAPLTAEDLLFTLKVGADEKVRSASSAKAFERRAADQSDGAGRMTAR
ncbi:MAG: ABC transporter substrate-binding protein [Blastocatellia bacterium]